MKFTLPLLFALFSQSGISGEEVAATDFIRVARDESSARLETAITSYEKDGVTVTLLGAVHLADQAYFKDLSTRFTKFDRLLFELIGGDNAAALKPNAPKTESPIHRLQKLAATFLKLADQRSEIDYTSKNFVHADLTAAEFQKLQEDRGESLLSFALDAAQNAEAENQPSTEALMAALLSGNPNKAKLLLIDSLAQGDETMGGLTAPSVVITDRNAKCLKVLEAEIAKGHQSLGIFYGAAHYPDMEASLLKQGYQKTKQEWIPAWSVPTS